jgi:dinuclear metal center YbgI/SA1388 family protein
MQIGDVMSVMESLAPLEGAEEWDRVGLLVGRRARTVTGPVLLTIDLTEAVIEEAATLGASMVIAYHPPVWEPLKRVTDASARERVVLRAIETGIAVYSPHTALDAAAGGINDWLAEGISGSATPGKIAGDCRALRAQAEDRQTQQLKIFTFMPEKDVDKVRSSLATAGAGIIGNYRVCSFATPGTGTFFGDASTKPAVGEAGRLERVAEVKLEMVCSREALPLAIETLRRFHPYEEPAIDVVPLEALPKRAAGAGRRLVLDSPARVHELAARLKKFLGCDVVHAALPWADRQISHVGMCAGAGAELLPAAAGDDCELFVTGELKHHDVLDAMNRGVAVLLAGHTNTERGYLPRLAEKLAARARERSDIGGAGVRFIVSREDGDPLRVL